MKIPIYCVLLFFAYSGFGQSEADDQVGSYGQKELKKIKKRAKKLNRLSYKKAVKKYGEPFENSKLELTKEELGAILSDELITEHFPHLDRGQTAAYLKEASWKILESWITVWYIMENSIWKPINQLVTI